MRKVTREVVNDFLASRRRGGTASRDNVYINENGFTIMALHDGPIARFRKAWHIDGEVNLTWAHTPTTRRRLNGLPGVEVKQRNYEIFFNDWPAPRYGWVPVNGRETPNLRGGNRKGYEAFEKFIGRYQFHSEIRTSMGEPVLEYKLNVDGLTILLRCCPWASKPSGRMKVGRTKYTFDKWAEFPVLMDKVLEEAA